MPDAAGRFKGISVPAMPWLKEKPDGPPEDERDEIAKLSDDCDMMPSPVRPKETPTP